MMFLVACPSRGPVSSSEGPPDEGAGGDEQNTDAGLDGGTDGGARETSDAGVSCVNAIEEVPYASPECRVHIPEDQTPQYIHNPPVAGEHFPVWARWQKYTTEVPRGYWVHNLEHGGVIFLYRPDVSEQIWAALNRIYDASPPEQDCVDTGLPHNRVILTPDHLLDVPWAVTVSGPESEYCVGSGYRIKSDCIASEQALIDFAVQHRNKAIETFCDHGDYPYPP